MIRDISDDKEVQEALRRKQPRPNTQFRRVQVLQPEEERLKKGPFTLVVPDGRVYRETELHVIVERAEPLRDSMRDSMRDPMREPLRPMPGEPG